MILKLTDGPTGRLLVSESAGLKLTCSVPFGSNAALNVFHTLALYALNVNIDDYGPVFQNEL